MVAFIYIFSLTNTQCISDSVKGLIISWQYMTVFPKCTSANSLHVVLDRQENEVVIVLILVSLCKVEKNDMILLQFDRQFKKCLSFKLKAQSCF